jgi:hypothetical protein
VDGWLLADEYHRHNPDRPVVLLSEEILKTEYPPVDAVFVPPHAPMRVLETLKRLASSETVDDAPVEMLRAA